MQAQQSHTIIPQSGGVSSKAQGTELRAPPAAGRRAERKPCRVCTLEWHKTKVESKFRLRHVAPRRGKTAKLVLGEGGARFAWDRAQIRVVRGAVAGHIPRSRYRGKMLGKRRALPKPATPHPVLLPMGEGTPEQRSERATTSPLRPHPLADADTLRRKLAKASLRGEGQDEGL